MSQDEEKVSIQAYEFWCSISDEEVSRLFKNIEICGYSQKALGNLWAVIKQHYLNRNVQAEKLEPDAWNNVKAASSLLENLCLCTGDELIDLIFELIREYIASENPKIRDSVMLAFGSVLSSNSLKLKAILPDAFGTILGMLNDTNQEVRTTVAWCLKKISEYHTDIFRQNRSLLDTFVNVILAHLSGNKKVTTYLCDTIHHLCFHLKTNDYSGILTPYYPGLLSKLLSTAFEQGAFDTENNVALSCLFAVGSLVDFASPDAYQIIDQVFPEIVGAFEKTRLSSNSFTDENARLAYQGYLATLISACTVEGKIRINKEQADHLFNLIKQTFLERNSVYEEGLMACSSLATCIGVEFLNYIRDFGGFLCWGLNNWQDISICRIAINSTSDLIRSIGQNLAPFMNEIIEHILNILVRIYLNVE
jgi:importin subunit beta-1